MFVVGKKYQGLKSGRVRECVLANEVEAVLQATDKTFVIAQQVYQSELHPEYHEPVVVKVERYVAYEEKSGEIWTSHKTGYPVGKIEITVTDGKLTDVRIL